MAAGPIDTYALEALLPASDAHTLAVRACTANPLLQGPSVTHEHIRTYTDRRARALAPTPVTEVLMAAWLGASDWAPVSHAVAVLPASSHECIFCHSIVCSGQESPSGDEQPSSSLLWRLLGVLWGNHGRVRESSRQGSAENTVRAVSFHGVQRRVSSDDRGSLHCRHNTVAARLDPSRPRTRRSASDARLAV